ncbi:MGMT family protein [Rutstroemia sp. NJR-2017a BVV2]|nr:MGMT family protein [Rutstroemia sp. NJR-2017a BVV2]
MPRSDEASAFYHSVYSAIQEIPYGKVTSYGHIARLIGTRVSTPPFLPSTRHIISAPNSFLPIHFPFLSKYISSPPQRPRQVGTCLKHLPSDPTLPFHNGNVPWQRVINSKGVISPRPHLKPNQIHPPSYTTPKSNNLRSNPAGVQNQAQVLRSEGVTVNTGSLGELFIDLGEYGWFPRQLPSEAAAGLDPPVDSEDEDEEGD